MLAEIPRTPTFPEHMILKEIKRIEKDVEDDVIPVSAGIYSEHKLVERLQAIPKPDVVNYQDPIFYQLVDVSRFPCKTAECPLCAEEYSTKKNIATQCHFCGVWNCSDCICPRKRYHPRAKESNSDRYSICFKCDDKFLNLTLNHNFVEQKALLEEAISRMRKQKIEYEQECDKRETDSNYAKNLNLKHNLKISALKKEGVDCRKNISKLQLQRDEETMKLRVREKYLALLMRKKEEVKQNQERTSQQQNYSSVQSASPPETSKIQKSIRSLSQNNVYSQSIHVAAALQQEKENSIKETSYTRAEQNYYSPNEKETQPIKEEKVLNFFNYEEWGSTQQKQEEPIYQANRIEERHESGTTTPVEQQQQHETATPETPSQQHMAEIFSNPQPLPQYEQDSDQDMKSLDGQTIKIRKAALMKAAIEQSHKSRFQSLQQQLSSSDPKKCNCEIY